MACFSLSQQFRKVSPWQDAPSDVLIEIFRECIEPLKYEQPNTTVAPMLLCQVCSYWRYVALGAPQLWDSLYHTCKIIPPKEHTESSVLKNCIRAKDVRFLQWWCKNLGTKSSQLRLRLDWSHVARKSKHPELGVNEDSDQAPHPEEQCQLFESLISSAKYLDLDPSYVTVLSNWTSLRPFSFPNLNTLVMRHDTCTTRRQGTLYRGVLAVPMNAAHTRPIQQLYLEAFRFPDSKSLAAFNWIHLTHASLLHIHIPLPVWHHLIRCLTSMQSGFFQICSFEMPNANTHFMNSRNDDGYSHPPMAILPFLHTLHLSLPPHRILTSQILLALSLPSLRHLRLSSLGLSLSSLHAILSSTPSLTQLQLCGSIPFCWTSHTISIPPAIPPHPTQSACTPLTEILPNLTHLLLDGSMQNNHMVLSWVCAVLSSPWLQLPMRGGHYQRHHSHLDSSATFAAATSTESDATNAKRRGITHLHLAISNPSDTIPDGDDTNISAQQQFPLTLYNSSSTHNEWMPSHLFSMERSNYVMQKLKSIVAKCDLDPTVEVVIRGPDAPKLWSGNLINEDENPAFEVSGFFPLN
ncbi:hypothetical protein JR316_0010762 [Psilocybe cubensis]|uniref:Uncharacterized protein n=2 Tax=Psilocybe cubensis TaxID=181762 RepID=A0ACB8GNP9_PSICU|nr:hypothetical protein JR316_0010762 [Psilocybe cubensis]KAH9476846.1 hypothetical protein JR316_0010762 [Psilocybe cubensis]